MEIVGIVARVIIGLVLLAAGVAKLRTRTWGLLAMESGTPRPIVVTLPAVEVLLGSGLIIQILQPWIEWVSVALFVGFTAVVVQRYASGSRAGCNCFGTNRSQEPVDGMTIARNVVLVLVALAGTLR